MNKEEEDKNGHKGAKEDLVDTLFHTSNELMPQLTNIPLNMVPALARMVVNEEGMKMLASRMARRKETPILLSEVFRQSLYQHRRSIRGDHKMALATLTQEELAAKMGDELGDSEDL